MKADGGPAFSRPATPETNNRVVGTGNWMSADPGHPGMSLRDWFAGQVATAFVADLFPDAEENYRNIARRSYALAGALLKARSKGSFNEQQ